MRRLLFPGFVIALLLLFSFLCLGDTIYLKNGEKIQASYVKVQGNQVMFKKFGGMVSLPMSLVDRVESDSFIEPTRPAASPAPEGSTPATPGTPAEPGSQAAQSGQEQAAQEGQQTGEESKEVDPDQEKKTPEYWIKRKQQLTSRLTQAEEELKVAQSNNFAHRYAAGAGLERSVKKIEALENEIAQLKADLANLSREAARYGIPPGVLRE